MGGSPTPPQLGPHRLCAPAVTPFLEQAQCEAHGGRHQGELGGADKTTAGLGRHQQSTEGIPCFAEVLRD